MKTALLAAQSPAQPDSHRIRRLRLIGEIGAAVVGTLLGAALALAAAPARANLHAAPPGDDGVVAHSAEMDRAPSS